MPAPTSKLLCCSYSISYCSTPGAVAQVGSTGQDGRHRDEEEAGAKDIYYPAPSSSAGAAENGQLGDIEDSERVQEVDSVHEEIGVFLFLPSLLLLVFR